jgi:hypothetical protein
LALSVPVHNSEKQTGCRGCSSMDSPHLRALLLRVVLLARMIEEPLHAGRRGRAAVELAPHLRQAGPYRFLGVGAQRNSPKRKLKSKAIFESGVSHFSFRRRKQARSPRVQLAAPHLGEPVLEDALDAECLVRLFCQD